MVRKKQNSHQAFCFTRALTMTTSNVIDPHHMTMQERREEVASILALGLIRLRTDTPPPVAVEKKKDLGFSPAQRVHTNPASRVRMEIRETLLAQKKEFE
jgi:hypothetical protein